MAIQMLEESYCTAIRHSQQQEIPSDILANKHTPHQVAKDFQKRKKRKEEEHLRSCITK